MNILIIGGNGTIGRRVAAHLSMKHNVIIAGRSSGELRVDIADSASIEHMYKSAPKLDAVICAAGEAKWAPFAELSEDDYAIGYNSKLMGQVNLVRIGKNYLNGGGSFTLTTGILADDPVPMTASAAMVNGGIHSFMRAAALELPNALRVNAVSAGLVEDAVEKYQDYFAGHNAVPMNKVVNAYVRSVEGKRSGDVIRVYE